MLNLNLKSKFKKIIPASMAFAALLTVAPLSSFAAETDAPVKNNVVNFPQTNYNVTDLNQTVSLDEDGEVSAQGWKKQLLVNGLKWGGEALESLLGYLGKTSYKNIIKENRLSLAHYLERTEALAHRGLKNFFIDECGASASTADVLADAVLAIAL
ncbi:hypothetical protein IIC_06067 [Bacillus cereus VD021]|uniref:Uncharacterized protein n=1 Tax=Bacillus cereus VD021 TaxID=1053224 RepID=R8GY67_BACCE|nr:hypothetical protein [Bacillus cereus]EOO65521.1 hypothetical protein IIC_06067 [Bacillus cereus VD021]